MKKKFLIYDERAALQGTDEATVISMCDTEKGAIREAESLGYNSVIYSYRVEKGNKLVDEKFVTVMRII